MVCGDCASKSNTAAPVKPEYSEADAVDVVKVQDDEAPASSGSLVYEDAGSSTRNSRGERLFDRTGREERWTLEPIKAQFPVNSKGGTFYFLTTLAWTLLIGSTGEIGISIWMMLKIMRMPRTFAWKSVLLPFGSVNIGSSESASLPVIPFLQAVITVFVVIFAFSSLVSSKKIYLNAMKFVFWIQCIFGIPVIPISFALWKYKKSHLRQTMTTAMSSASEFSKYWNITQLSGDCCGVDGPDDWIQVSGESATGNPNSCCVLNNFDPPRGCYEIESNTLETSGIIFIATLVAGILLAGAELYTLISRNELLLRHQHEPALSSVQTFLLRQGSCFMSLTLTGNGTSLHLPGVLLEANGALASNIAVVENQATLRIADFRNCLDHVKIEQKVGKISILVERNGGVRGRCAVCTTDEILLEEVKVEDTKDGTVKVAIPRSLI